MSHKDTLFKFNVRPDRGKYMMLDDSIGFGHYTFEKNIPRLL